MKIIYTIFIVLLFVSCGKISPKGDIEQKQIPLKAFTGIEAQGKFRIFWVKSPQNMLEIETYPNFIENLDIAQKDKTLIIKEKRETQGLGFYNLTLFSDFVPKAISLSDSIEFNVSGQLKIDDFQLKMNKNAKFIGFINTKNTTLEMQNQSLANFQGFTEVLSVSLRDTAQVVAPYFTGNVLHIQAQNGAFAEFAIKDTIKGELKHTSKLWYYETPVLKVKKEATVEVKKQVR